MKNRGIVIGFDENWFVKLCEIFKICFDFTKYNNRSLFMKSIKKKYRGGLNEK